jgi:hypothetical protein
MNNTFITLLQDKINSLNKTITPKSPDIVWYDKEKTYRTIIMSTSTGFKIFHDKKPIDLI